MWFVSHVDVEVFKCSVFECVNGLNALNTVNGLNALNTVNVLIQKSVARHHV